MARRQLAVWIDADAKHCGRCHHADTAMVNRFGTLDLVCGAFRVPLAEYRGAWLRCDDCLKAETFAGG